MDLAQTPPDAIEPSAAGSRADRGRVVRLAVWVSVAVIALTAALAYRHWKNTAGYLGAYSGVDLVQHRWLPGRTEYIGADVEPISAPYGSRRLDMHTVRPQITVNTADASVVVLTCRVADPHMGMGSDTTTSVCATTATFRSGTIDLGFPATEIIYKITPRRPGTVRIEGADVTYCGSGRCGDQDAGRGFVMYVVASSH